MDTVQTNNGKKGGLLKGKPHYDKNGKSLGGIKAVVTDAGGKPVELEGGEVIINKEASKKHWKTLSKINQSAGNGVPIGPPEGADEDPDEYKEGGKVISFNPNHIPNKWVYQYAKTIKTKHPEIWKLGGNIFGNEAFINLERVLKRGHWLDSEEWMYIKWRSYVARHKGDFRIEGVVAMLKWCDKVEKGWAYMKDLIEEKIDKIKSKSTKFSEGGGVHSSGHQYSVNFKINDLIELPNIGQCKVVEVNIRPKKIYPNPFVSISDNFKDFKIQKAFLKNTHKPESIGNKAIILTDKFNEEVILYQYKSGEKVYSNYAYTGNHYKMSEGGGVEDKTEMSISRLKSEFKNEPQIFSGEIIKRGSNEFKIENGILYVKRPNENWKQFRVIKFEDGGGVESKRDYLEHRLWNERGYEYSYLKKLNQKELRSLYDTEFYYDFEDDVERWSNGAMVKKTNIPKENTGGNCYEVAGNIAMDNKMPKSLRNKSTNFNGTPFVVHAQVTGQGAIDNVKYGHAWVEDDVFVYDFSNGRELIIPKELYYYIGQVEMKKPIYYKYPFDVAVEKMLSTKHYGPWELKTESGL